MTGLLWLVAGAFWLAWLILVTMALCLARKAGVTMHWSQFLPSLATGLIAGLTAGTGLLTLLRRERRATMPVTTPAGCPGQSSMACTCDGTCRPAPVSGCACLACGGGSFGPPGVPSWYAAGGIVQAGGAGGSSSHGSSAGGAGGGGGSSNMGASLAPLSSFAVSAPAPRGSGAGMTGFAEAGASEFEFAAGSVLGLRQWTLASPDFRGDPHDAASNWPVTPLRGATGFAWPPGEQALEAGCNNGYNHPPPVEVDPVTGRCGCGWWAYWDMASLSANRPMSFSGSGLPVLGVIEGYGRVLLGERGFRSQKAKIAALAPAFSVRAELAWPQPSSGESPWDRPALSAPGDDPYLVYAEQHKAAERAQLHADSWMAMIQDRLGQMYPAAQVFATVNGLLASVQTRGRPA